MADLLAHPFLFYGNTLPLFYHLRVLLVFYSIQEFYTPSLIKHIPSSSFQSNML